MIIVNHSLQKIAFLIGSATETRENQTARSLGHALQELLPGAGRHYSIPYIRRGAGKQILEESASIPPALAVAKRLCRQGNLNQATEILLYLHDEASFHRDIRGQALAMNQLGVVRRMQRRYEEACSDLTRALIDFQKLQDFQLVAEGINNLGMLSFKKFEYERAANSFDEAQHLCKSLKYYSLLGFVFLNKSELFMARRDYAMAAQMCIFGLTHHVKNNVSLGVARACLLIGQILWKCQQLRSATAVCLESIRLYRMFNIPLGLANSCSEFSTLLGDVGEIGEAKEYHREAHTIYREMGIDVH